VSSG